MENTLEAPQELRHKLYVSSPSRGSQLMRFQGMICQYSFCKLLVFSNPAQCHKIQRLLALPPSTSSMALRESTPTSPRADNESWRVETSLSLTCSRSHS